jgi:MYXO-CTERM domain-containing protein
VTLPQDIAYADFKNCTQCYLSATGVTFNSTTFLRQLYEMVIKPMQETQALFDSRPYLTRLYTTMSADEMTMDPVFAFNPDLDDVSNIHTATQVLECGKSGDPFGADAPWSVELPQGGTVRGAGNARVWPIDVMSQPAALRIMQFGTSGEGEVLEDRSKSIAEKNPAPPSKPSTGLAGSGSTVTAGRGGSAAPPKTGTGGTGASAPVAPPNLGDKATEDEGNDGCSVAHARGSDALSLLLLAAIPLLRRRRR